MATFMFSFTGSIPIKYFDRNTHMHIRTFIDNNNNIDILTSNFNGKHSANGWIQPMVYTDAKLSVQYLKKMRTELEIIARHYPDINLNIYIEDFETNIYVYAGRVIWSGIIS